MSTVALVAIAPFLIAAFVPSSRRSLWIIGLSVALTVFGGFTAVTLIALIMHRHLNAKGVLMLVCDGYTTWMIVRYLYEILRSPKADPPLEPS